MECATCGTAVPDEASFCHSCGSQVSDAEGQARVSASMDMSSIQHMEKLLKEDTKGEYEIGDLLGRGGMAMVYLAEEVHLARKVAIKVLPPELTFGHGVERFKREAKTAAGLDHPNIIPIYRIASGGKVFWYAMKFLEGQSLDEMLKEKGRCSLEETSQILMHVADALDYGHLHSVIHRDIKPANIMLDAQNRVVVTDFGIAKALTEGTLTASGSVIGTPYYMSPEQGMGKPVTGAADQYSVAVMTYRMLSGQVPFEGDSAIDILHKHCTILPPPLDLLCPGLPDYVYKAIEKGLAKKPAQRFSNVKAFVKALKESSPEITLSDAATVVVDSNPSILGDLPTEVMAAADTPMPTGRTAATTAQPAAPVEKKSNLWKILVPLIVILAAGGGGGGWWWMTQRGNGGSGGGEPQAGQTDPSEAGQASVGLLGETPAAAAAAESTAEEAVPPAPGTINVTNLLPSGFVSIDGTQQESPEGIVVSSGDPHEIRIVQASYQTITDSLTLDPGQVLTYRYTGQRDVVAQPRPQQPTPQRPAAPQYGGILIQIRPSSGANILIDGRLVESSTTRYLAIIEAREHLIRIERDGFIPFDTTMTIAPNDTTRLRVRLEPRNES
jgi:serine/threonine protein kinase